jgi:uncharacterized protein YqcC (DUF446 family)
MMVTAGCRMSLYAINSDPNAASVVPDGEVPTLLPALVDCIERELRTTGLWEKRSPPPDAFCSDVPFHLDTMRFVQWLQWVFVPRMRRMLRNRMPLPTTCRIHPLAVDELRDIEADTHRLLSFIAGLDRLLSERGQRLH